MGFLLENCLFSRLTAEIICQCQSYTCSKDPDIDSFFHNGNKDNYLDYNEELMGFSHCFYTDEEDPQMVCAFTLSNTSLRTSPLPKTERNRFNKAIPNSKRRAQYPAILVGQLCVFDAFTHHNIGSELMDLIKTIAIQQDTCASRYLIVDAVNTPKVLSFYEGNGFQYLFMSEEEDLKYLHESKFTACKTRLMYFDLILLSPTTHSNPSH